MKFKKAQRTLAKLRLALTGTSGSGKTFGALLLAKGLGGRIAVIDTERGSASLYADLPGMPEFDTLELDEPFSPERYIEAIKCAEDAGYDICIVDSMTHEWSGTGGCLEINDQLARSKYRGNTWSAWNEVTPRHRKFVDTILQSKMHMICTMRSKADTAQEKDGSGKTKVVKVGMKTEQRDGMDYEFSLVFDISADGHFANASKDRTSLFNQPVILSEEIGKKLREWIDTAKPVSSAPDMIPAIPPAPLELREDFRQSAIDAAEAGKDVYVAWGRRMAIEEPLQMGLFKSLPLSTELWHTAQSNSMKE